MDTDKKLYGLLWEYGNLDSSALSVTANSRQKNIVHNPMYGTITLF